MKTKRTLLIGRFGCGKASLMLWLLKDKNPDDVYKICKTEISMLQNITTNLVRYYA